MGPSRGGRVGCNAKPTRTVQIRHTEIRQVSPEVAANEHIVLQRVSARNRISTPSKGAKTYPFEVAMDDILGVQVLETHTYIHQLKRISRGPSGRQGEPTSLNRSKWGLLTAKSRILPFGIHGDTRHGREPRRVKETPYNGRIFGWRKCFQMTASSDNFWATLSPTRTMEGGKM